MRFKGRRNKWVIVSGQLRVISRSRFGKDVIVNRDIMRATGANQSAIVRLVYAFWRILCR